MAPNSSRHNPANLSSARMIFTRKCSLCDSERTFLSYHQNVGLGEFYHAVFFAACLSILLNFVGHIISLRSDKEMQRTDAFGNVARVEDEASFGYRADKHNPTGDVGVDASSVVETELTVSKGGLSCRPFPATVFEELHLFKKMLKAHYGAFVLPSTTRGRAIHQVHSVKDFGQSTVASAQPKRRAVPVYFYEGKNGQMTKSFVGHILDCHAPYCNTWRVV
jgi:hypothetical protein